MVRKNRLLNIIFCVVNLVFLDSDSDLQKDCRVREYEDRLQILSLLFYTEER